jgi:hypothetical protein
MIFALLSTPTCVFIPKYHGLPFFVWCISGSRFCSRFLVEVGACRMVASTIVPVVIRTPLGLQVQVHRPQDLFPPWCSSSKCRNLHTVVSPVRSGLTVIRCKCGFGISASRCRATNALPLRMHCRFAIAPDSIAVIACSAGRFGSSFWFCFSIAGQVHGTSPGWVPVGLRSLAEIEPWQKPRLTLFRAWFHAMIVRRGAVFA